MRKENEVPCNVAKPWTTAMISWEARLWLRPRTKIYSNAHYCTHFEYSCCLFRNWFQFTYICISSHSQRTSRWTAKMGWWTSECYSSQGRRFVDDNKKLMQQYNAQFWLLPMREYAEDPVFWSISSPTKFSARYRLWIIITLRRITVLAYYFNGTSFSHQQFIGIGQGKFCTFLL